MYPDHPSKVHWLKSGKLVRMDLIIILGIQIQPRAIPTFSITVEHSPIKMAVIRLEPSSLVLTLPVISGCGHPTFTSRFHTSNTDPLLHSFILMVTPLKTKSSLPWEDRMSPVMPSTSSMS